MALNVPSVGRCHHVGAAVKDLTAAVTQLQAAFGAQVESEIIHDQNQKVRLQFIRLGDLLVELLEPAGSPSPLDGLLKRGVAFYQICHEVRDLDGELARLRQSGVSVVSPPKPAEAFGGRRVAFVMCQGLVIELLEAGEEKGGEKGSHE